MLSQKAKYGVRALVELARADEAQLSAGELATRAEAPRKFLAQLAENLRHFPFLVCNEEHDRAFFGFCEM